MVQASCDARPGKGPYADSMAGACGTALAECDYDIDDMRHARAPATPPICSGMAETV